MRTRKSVVKQLDKTFGDYIKARDHDTCVTCGNCDNIQCGHLFSRVAYSTRWNEMNAYCQCRSCNLSHEYDFIPLLQYAIRKHGQPAIDALHALFHKPRKYSTDALAAMVVLWRETLENLR